MNLTAARYRTLKSLFLEAAQLAPDERDAFLGAACSDAGLREQVERLLRAHGKAPVVVDRVVQLDPGAFEVPGWTLTRLIGEGGSSLVFEARGSTHPTAAVKVLRPDETSDSVWRRFEREAELLRRFDHPGIARLLDAGRAETPLGVRPFLAIELVRGQPVTAWAETHALDDRERVQLVVAASEAVAAAHAAGVLHRDIKPSNVLVAHDDCRPRVVDFGLAKLVGDPAATSLRTRTGEFMGTLAYASPEQAAGRWSEVDERTDVYGLGTLLFALLTGQPPRLTEGLPLGEVLRRAAREPVRRLTELRPDLGGPLDRILSTALELRLDRRYASARAFARDLVAILDGRPVLAAARHSRSRVVAGLLAVGACSVLAVAWWPEQVVASDDAAPTHVVGTGPEQSKKVPRGGKGFRGGRLMREESSDEIRILRAAQTGTVDELCGIFARELETLSARRGPDSRATAGARRRLALALREAGRLDEAQIHADVCLRRHEASDGIGSPPELRAWAIALDIAAERARRDDDDGVWRDVERRASQALAALTEGTARLRTERETPLHAAVLLTVGRARWHLGDVQGRMLVERAVRMFADGSRYGEDSPLARRAQRILDGLGK